MSTISKTSATSRIVAALTALLLTGAATDASAQNLFKFQDDDGNWIFSDRQPADGLDYELVPLAEASATPALQLYQSVSEDGESVLVADNGFHSWVQLSFEFVATRNLDAGVPTRGNRIVPPRSKVDLFALTPADPARVVRAEYRYAYIHGHPGARHEPERPYRLPYALANRHLVTQAYPEQVTHTDQTSSFAVDFEMPIGTGVFAARSGLVVEVAGEYFEAGMDPSVDGPRANMVRILHDDGSFALYAHLNWNSIRVSPGQRVARGEYVADSGNTGFSSGPHLHFVVQINRAGVVESVPVEFAGLGDVAVTLQSGDSPVAY